jgi:hypothetical protein
MPFLGYGLIFNYWWLVIAMPLIVGGLIGWTLEPSTDPDAGHDHDDSAHAAIENAEVAVSAAASTTGEVNE